MNKCAPIASAESTFGKPFLLAVFPGVRAAYIRVPGLGVAAADMVGSSPGSSGVNPATDIFPNGSDSLLGDVYPLTPGSANPPIPEPGTTAAAVGLLATIAAWLRRRRS